MLRVLVPGAVVALLASAAMLAPKAAEAAAPTSSLLTEFQPATSQDALVQVAHRDRHHRGHYRPGGRYGRPPAHWRRYHRRPLDWYARGCVVVGPVWFCP